MLRPTRRLYLVAMVALTASLLGIALALAAPSSALINPSNLQLSNLRFSANEVAPGTAVTITALVTNHGSVDGTSEIVLKVHGAVAEIRSVAVPVQAGVDVSFVFTPPNPGTYAMEFGEISDTVTPLLGTIKAVTPPQPATCTLSGLSLSPAQVAPGGNVTVSVNVTNSGEVAGTCTVILFIDGVEVDRKDVNVDTLSADTVNFTFTDLLLFGEHTISIGELSTVLTVVPFVLPRRVMGTVILEALTDHSGARVTFSGKSPVVTDANGNFGIDLADGTYTVTVEMDGYLKATKLSLVVNQDMTLPTVRLVADDIDGNGLIDVKDLLVAGKNQGASQSPWP